RPPPGGGSKTGSAKKTAKASSKPQERATVAQQWHDPSMAGRRKHEQFRPEIFDTLVARRLELNLSQREVAKLTDGALSWAAVSRLETGLRYPTLQTLLMLGYALQLSFHTSPDGSLKIIRTRPSPGWLERRDRVSAGESRRLPLRGAGRAHRGLCC